MKYYHNININCTAEEQWVADYLYMSGQVESRDEALAELRSKRECCSWYECGVSDTIEEAMEYGKLNY